jgi:hypothetical protein
MPAGGEIVMEEKPKKETTRAPEHDKEPRVEWKLTEADKKFLRSCSISPD